MRITLTLAQVELVYLHNERDRAISADVWALLYIAARSGGIDVIDALNCLRRDKDANVTDEDVIYAEKKRTERMNAPNTEANRGCISS